MKQDKFTWLVALVLLVGACTPAATPSPTSGVTPPPTTQGPSTPTPKVPSTPSTSPTATHSVAPTTSPGTTQSRYGGTLRAGVAGEPTWWDFMAVSSGGRFNRFNDNLVFNGLFTIPQTPESGCSMENVLQLAESYRWVNDLTLEIKIRKGVYFQNKPPVNGREMTANDVAYSLERLAKKQSRVGDVALRLQDIQAKDPGTVVITLKQPWADLAGASFLATRYGAHVLARESGGPKESWEDPETSWIGTGPFMFAGYKPGVSIGFVKNPKYWKPGLPYVDGLVFQVIPDVSTLTAALRSGTIDLIHQDASLVSAIDLKRQKSPIKAYSCPDTNFYSFWPRSDIPPLDDVRVRRALSMAIDRDATNKSIFFGEGTPATGTWVPPMAGTMWLDGKNAPAEIRKYAEYHSDEAKRLLADAGYSPEKPLKFSLWSSPGLSFDSQRMAEALTAAWDAVGVKAKLELPAFAYYTGTVLAGKYEGITTVYVSMGELFPALTYFTSALPSVNRGRVADETINKLKDELLRTTDPDKQRDLMTKIQLRVVEEGYQFGVALGPHYTLSQPWVQNFGPMTEQAYSGRWAEVAWLSRP